MQSLLLKTLIAAALIAGASPAAAASFRAEAKLATAAPTPVTTNIEGVDWRCDGVYCTSAPHKPGLNSLMKECRKVAAAVGPLKAYTSRGRELSPANIQSCNKGATEGEAAVAAN